METGKYSTSIQSVFVSLIFYLSILAVNPYHLSLGYSLPFTLQVIPPGMEFGHVASHDADGDGESEGNEDNPSPDPPIWFEV